MCKRSKPTLPQSMIRGATKQRLDFATKRVSHRLPKRKIKLTQRWCIKVLITLLAFLAAYAEETRYAFVPKSLDQVMWGTCRRFTNIIAVWHIRPD